MSDYLNPFYISPEEARLDDWSDGDFPFEPHELELMSLDPYLATIRAILEMRDEGMEVADKWRVIKNSGAFLACEGGEGVRNMWEIIAALVFERVLGLSMVCVDADGNPRERLPDIQGRFYKLAFQGKLFPGSSTILGAATRKGSLSGIRSQSHMIAYLMNEMSFVYPFSDVFDWLKARQVEEKRSVEAYFYRSRYLWAVRVKTDMDKALREHKLQFGPSSTMYAMMDAWEEIKKKSGYTFGTVDKLVVGGL